MSNEPQDKATDAENVANTENVESAKNEENSEQQTTEQSAEPAAEEQAEPTVDSLSEELEAVRAELAAAQAEAAHNKDVALRSRAEMENIRRRAEADVSKAHKFALEKFSNELLPVIDNLERAIDLADKSDEAIKPMVEGVELTLKTFLSSVEKFGITPIDPQGEMFNPEKHQAMSMQPNAELPANTVIAVMQKGYDLNGRLLRPAMVMVSKAAPKVDENA